jgi:PAS domain S-box-containing protein
VKLTDLLDIEELRGLCESYTEITGAVTALLDLEGNILIATGWRDICTQFHRKHPITAHRCLESDTALAARLALGASYNVYKCKNGLVDVAVPITIAGEHLGNFFTGQFFFDTPDRSDFAQQAKEFCFDESTYLEALNRVPVFSEQQVRSMMAFFTRLANVLGEIGLTKMKLQQANSELKASAAAIQAAADALIAKTDVLRKSEERFKAIFMRAPFGISVIDSFNGDICEANQKFAEIAGRSLQELTNIDWMQITHPDDVKADVDQMALLNAGTIDGFQMEKRYLYPDGRSVWIDMTVIKLNSDDIAHPLHFCITQDMTERKQSEAARKILDQQLRDYQFYTRSLFESNVDALSACDSWGIITDINKQMETLTGCTRDELIGAPFRNYFTDPEAADVIVKRVLVERKVTDYELTVCNLDGRETVVSLNASTFYDRNRILLGVFAAAREVSSRNAFSRIDSKNVRPD